MRILAILIAFSILSCTSENMEYGKFEGKVIVEWLDDENGEDRKMKLLENFTYIDPNGKKWTAKKGYETDGASIPKAFWSLVGGPFEGGYRKAAVIHDWYCDSKSEPWKDVHRIFYYANRASGVNEFKSKVLYTAVLVGGPKWGNDNSNCYGCHQTALEKDKNGRSMFVPAITDDDVKKIYDWISDKNPELSEIEKYITESYPNSKFGH